MAIQFAGSGKISADVFYRNLTLREQLGTFKKEEGRTNYPEVNEDQAYGEQYLEALASQESRIDELPDSFKLLISSEIGNDNKLHDVIELTGEGQGKNFSLKFLQEKKDEPASFLEQAVTFSEGIHLAIQRAVAIANGSYGTGK